jgi:hypothetical protein
MTNLARASGDGARDHDRNDREHRVAHAQVEQLRAALDQHEGADGESADASTHDGDEAYDAEQRSDQVLEDSRHALAADGFGDQEIPGSGRIPRS